MISLSPVSTTPAINTWLTTGVVDTGDELFASVVETGDKRFPRCWWTFEIALMECSGSRGKLIHVKNL